LGEYLIGFPIEKLPSILPNFTTLTGPYQRVNQNKVKNHGDGNGCHF
jgi:hypothetical protein